jgi:hypothetical protein
MGFSKITEEIKEMNRRVLGDQRESSARATSLYQTVVFYTENVEFAIDVKRLFRTEHRTDIKSFTYPFYSEEVFLSAGDAERFIPIFVKRLITRGLVPETVVGPNQILDDNVIKSAVASLTLTTLERTEEL